MKFIDTQFADPDGAWLAPAGPDLPPGVATPVSPVRMPRPGFAVDDPGGNRPEIIGA